MTKRRFKEFLNEAPVGDYQTIGNFEKNSSFRKPTDRKMITSDKAIRNVRKKFGKTPYNFNLYFVNSPKANKHTEVGEVNMDWIEQNLDPQVAQALEKSPARDSSINIVYTNNKAAEHAPMTPWIMAHRFAHAVGRRNGSDITTWSPYNEVRKHLISQVGQMMEYYGRHDFDVRNRGYDDSGNARKNQLAMIYLFNEMGSFKSARDKNLRDWFEILNELLAEYIITGKVHFRPLPQCIGGGSFGKKQTLCAKKEDMEEIHNFQEALARDMELMLDDVLSEAVGHIYVM